jgi:anaerobic selenocysteine-containing dehydrogenase
LFDGHQAADQIPVARGPPGPLTSAHEAVFGSAYGWSSAGRFQRAQAQLHRFLNYWHRLQPIAVHDQVWNAHAKLADIVLPATFTLEREDIGSSTRNPLYVAMRQVDKPPGLARDDHTSFANLAAALGAGETFTLGCSAQSCLVEVRKALNPPSPRPFELPTLVESQTKTKFF